MLRQAWFSLWTICCVSCSISIMAIFRLQVYSPPTYLARGLDAPSTKSWLRLVFGVKRSLLSTLRQIVRYGPGASHATPSDCWYLHAWKTDMEHVWREILREQLGVGGFAFRYRIRATVYLWTMSPQLLWPCDRWASPCRNTRPAEAGRDPYVHNRGRVISCLPGDNLTAV